MQRKVLRRLAFGFVASLATTLVLAGPAWSQTGSASGSGGSGSASGSSSGSGGIPLPSATGIGALTAAATQIGKPYEWGANGPHAWDCSALVQWAFRQVGVELPRTTWEQAKVGMPVTFRGLAPGDVVILNGDGSHVGIYAGMGQILDAHDWGVPVGLHPLREFDIFTIRRF
ncbi:NlpC/P60 family protein [Nocardia asteroides]|uniref:NlpC/P60 family protein n=1 Tax=Nocardia asteroides TaxID=1824 RepID=UPI0003180ACB|nr:NlpC/P60 family protein [Nocardia asteroides]TLF62449.1 NlpC/P60 family protein [Nocardia asteroides NBRC 15531]UGT46660.1 C40 family peptidase [Nocardia asteroides]SFN60534.1 Cell wall-associated hydrolase, NlpC family [Nocardia asteroides]VEG34503.1 Probable endopeptidase cgR_2070 precursor [Nocardia asteroides]